MIAYTYLLVDLLSFAIPFLYSFGPRLAFYKQYSAWLPAILLTSCFFIAWDILFAHWHIWGFNDRYLLGITWMGLPLEEWLFFFAIPYPCIFLYEALNHFFQENFLEPYQQTITLFLIGISAGIGITHLGKIYTASACLLTASALAWHCWYLKSSYLGKFYRAYLVILFPFLIVNEILTGAFFSQPVVWYDNVHNLGIRIGTIPLEDFFYGMLLILTNLTFYEALKTKPRQAY
jgi:lycopene cyclase domain-containing protein